MENGAIEVIINGVKYVNEKEIEKAVCHGFDCGFSSASELMFVELKCAILGCLQSAIYDFVYKSSDGKICCDIRGLDKRLEKFTNEEFGTILKQVCDMANIDYEKVVNILNNGK